MRAREPSGQSRGHRPFGAAACALALLSAAPSRAEPSAALDLYRPSDTPEGGFVLARPAERRHLAPAAELHLEYASDPLVFEARRGVGESERVALVSDQATLHLTGSLGLFDLALVYAALPMHVSMRGTPLGNQPTATGAGFGDLAFGGRVGIGASEAGATAFQVTLSAPTAEGGRDGAPGVAGDEGMTFEPELLGELALGALRLVGNFGLRWRKNVTLAGVELRDVLSFGLGAVVPVEPESLDLHVEVHGATPVDEVGDRGATPAEALAGLKLRVEDGWSGGLGGGVGLTRGYGTPDSRFMVTFGWIGEPIVARAESAEPSEPLTPAPASSQGSEAIPGIEPVILPALADGDGDGVRDDEDRCPELPGEPGEAGCPQTFPDDRERASEPAPVPEPKGEPPPPPPPAPPRTTAALAAAIAANPGADDDGDGVWNGKDKCPLAPGQPARKGCPQGHDVDLEAGRFALTKRIRFTRAELDPRSDPWIAEIAATLKASPTMRVRIEAHGPGDAEPASSLALTKARAAAVRSRLEALGVPAAQMPAYGCGETRPIAPGQVPWGRKKNERVELVLLDPTPSSDVVSAAGCARAE